MIKYNNDIIGVKERGVNIHPEMVSIITSATKFIVVTGYSFTPSNAKTVLSILDNVIAMAKTGIPCLIICPTKYGNWYINKLSNLQGLVNSGVAVIINNHNHAKFLLTDNKLYFGSANFTSGGLNKNDEVIAIVDPLNIRGQRRAIQLDFLRFISRQILTYSSTTNILLPTNNSKLLSNIDTAILKSKRYNPSIEKVISTVNDADETKDSLFEAINIIFASYAFEDYIKYQKYISDSLKTFDKAIDIGYDLIQQLENNAIEEQKLLNNYNIEIDSFHSQLKQTKELIIKNRDTISLNREKDYSFRKNVELNEKLRGIMLDDIGNNKQNDF